MSTQSYVTRDDLIGYFDDIKELQKESRAEFKDIAERFKETDRLFKESKKERDRDSKEMKEYFKNLGEHLGGIGNSNGDFAEAFFISAIEKDMKLLDIDIDDSYSNQRHRNNKLQISEEYDMILVNTNIVIVVEIKYKFKTRYVNQLFNRKIPNFRKLYPQYKDYKLLVAIAAFSYDGNAIEQAKEKGYFVLSRTGSNMVVIK